ncbi:glycoside hydrolase [Paenibacillus thiaminolyticus]|uniref:glycoside hydrolase n=1 Tax=Paenibacillus thiaminolyticus TaxID=49283 RepID=UPI0035A58F10
MNKTLLSIVAAAMAISLLGGCSGQDEARMEPAVVSTVLENGPTASDFQYEVDPATFDIVIERDGVKEHASVPLKPRQVSGWKQEGSRAEWTYPEDQVKISVEKKDRYLDIRIQSLGADRFAWPAVHADTYLLPLGEGKRIPADDPNWKSFLREESLSWSESFSMNFMAFEMKQYTLLYVVDNPFNNEVAFDTESRIGMTFKHEFPAINPNKEYGFRLYVTDSDPAAAAKLYRAYMKEQHRFVALTDKAKDNPAIEKLYGAPHIYVWNSGQLEPEAIRWDRMRDKIDDPIWTWIAELADQYTEDGAQELRKVLTEARTEPLNAYHKRIMTRALNQVVKLKQLYRSDRFPHADDALLQTAAEGMDKLSEQKLYAFNKRLLQSAFPGAIGDSSAWGSGSAELVKEMYQAGIGKAWLGLPNWADGLLNPDMIEEAAESGYLIGPYDSYHSIQEKENKDWNTAYFPDPKLYEHATITDKTGRKIGGFLQRGRKLNPALSLPSVKRRVEDILQDGIPYNSWFIDCDATGEIYDDYSPEHPTTQEQDRNARLERMAYIAREKHMVIGSEGGNDFASGTIAFAHGLETPVIKWGDPDMREDKSSPYYVGAYWSARGGIPERYAKQVPIKELYRHIYTDPAYSVPLFKLVYNDSVITTHHWEWGSLKIKDEVADRMLYELLYNVPPLYHVDGQEWENRKEMIASYLAVWSPFHAKAVTEEMTAFQVLSPDRLLQAAEYGPDLKVVVNFSDEDAMYGEDAIKARSALIYDGGKRIRFDAASVAAEGNFP